MSSFPLPLQPKAQRPACAEFHDEGVHASTQGFRILNYRGHARMYSRRASVDSDLDHDRHDDDGNDIDDDDGSSDDDDDSNDDDDAGDGDNGGDDDHHHHHHHHVHDDSWNQSCLMLRQNTTEE